MDLKIIVEKERDQANTHCMVLYIYKMLENANKSMVIGSQRMIS